MSKLLLRTVMLQFIPLLILLSACAAPTWAQRIAETPPALSPAFSSPSAAPTSTPLFLPTIVGKRNPVGMLLDVNSPPRAALLQTFRLTFFRPATAPVVENWNGRCGTCDTARRAGLSLVLTVRANGGGFTPTAPPKDIAAYKQGLAEILAKYPPALLVVENEENSTLFYTGTPEEYGVELRAACQVAHARAVRCANGGLVSGEVALLVWDDYWERDKFADACSFAQRAFEPKDAQVACKVKTLADLPPRQQELLAKGKRLLRVCRASGMDYMNFHWYIADARALEETVAFLKRAVGLPVLTNEIGQHDENPSTVTTLLQKTLDLKLPYVIWFNLDAGKARACSNPDGSLRPNGEAFKTFMQAHFR